MNNDNFRIMLEAIKLGSLRKAAEKLGYSQPALTFMMNSLESELNLKILRRDRKGISLNDTGEALKDYIIDIINAEDAFWQKVTELKGISSLNVSAYPSIAETWLSAILTNFIENHPQSDVRLTLGLQRQIDWIEEGSVDFAIMDTRLAGPNYETLTLEDEPIYAVIFADAPEIRDMPPGTTIPIAELVKKYPVLTARHDSTSTTATYLKKLKVKKIISVSSSNSQILMRMVEQHLGIAFMSASHQQSLPPTLRMFPTDPPMNRTLCICAKKLSALTPLAREFIDDIQDYWYQRSVSDTE